MQTFFSHKKLFFILFFSKLFFSYHLQKLRLLENLKFNMKNLCDLEKSFKIVAV